MSGRFEDLDPCEDCGVADADDSLVPKRTLTRREFDEYRREHETRLLPRTDRRHLIDPAGVIGEYDFPEAELYCCYGARDDLTKHGHIHHKGCLCRSRCDYVLLIGSECAKRAILNYAQLERRQGLAATIRSEQEFQDGDDLPLLIMNIRDLEDRLTRRLRSRALLREHARQVYDVMREVAAAAAKDRRALRVEIRVPVVGSRPPRDEPADRELDGMVLFRDEVIADGVSDVVREADEFEQPVRVTEGNVRHVSKTRSRLQDAERELEGWLERTSRFWTKENLTLALVRTFEWGRVPDHFDVDGNVLVIGGSVRVGSEE